MSEKTSNGEHPAAETAVTLEPRTPRDLASLMFAGWPFGESTWAWPDLTPPTSAPIRVEEAIEDGQVVVRAEIPGVDPEKDIEVVVDEGVLTIRARKEEKKDQRSARGYRTEFRYGSFERRVRLPKGTSAEVVSASYRDGVLEVRMPAPAAGGTARKIDVQRS